MFVVAFFGWYRIVTRFSPWMATQYSFGPEPAAIKQAMCF